MMRTLRAWFPWLTYGALGLLVLALGACATPAPWQTPYTLSMPGNPAPHPSPASAASAPILRVAAVDAPPWLEGQGIAYRLLYGNPQEIEYYREARWAAPPPQMLGQLVQDALLKSDAWKGVLGPESPARADVTLSLRILDLAQDFERPRSSYGTLAVAATLIGDRDHRVLAQRVFRFRVRAPTPDAAGAVQSLSEASRHFALALQGWLLEEVPKA